MQSDKNGETMQLHNASGGSMKGNIYRRFIQLIISAIFAVSSLNGIFVTVRAESTTQPENQPVSASQTIKKIVDTPVKRSKQNQNPKLIEETRTSVTLELTTDNYSVEENPVAGGNCQQIKVENYSGSDKSGSPNLPERGTLVGIPVNAKPSLTVLDPVSEELTGEFNLCPISSPKIIHTPDGMVEYDGEEYIRDQGVYEKNSFTPTSPAELTGTAYIRNQRVAQINFLPFQYNPVTGKIRLYRKIQIRIDFGIAGTSIIKDTSPKNDGAFEEVFSNSISNYEAAKEYRQPEKVASHASYPDGLAEMKAKVLVNNDGYHKVTYENIVSAGLNLGEASSATLQLFNRGTEVALEVNDGQDGHFGPGDYFVFYGQKLDEKYTDTNVYWLTWGNQTGQRIQSIDATPGSAQTSENYVDKLRLETNSNYYSSYIDSRGDNWYWQMLSASSSKPASFSVDFNLDHLDLGTTKQALISGSFFSISASSDHHTQIFVNGNFVTEKVWRINSQYDFSVNFPMQYLVDGKNTIRVDVPLDGGRTLDAIFLNWFEVSSWKTFFATDNKLAFSGETSGETRFSIDGFTNTNIRLLDITNTSTPVRVENANFEPSANGNRMNFQTSTSDPHQYMAQVQGAEYTPVVVKETASDLKSTSNQADYLLITHADFAQAAQTLANWRTSQGLSVMAIDVQDIYDEFNDGIVDANAIRAFIDFAFHNWQSPAPQYVLLFGDGNYDPHNYLGTNEKSYIPPYQLNVDRHLIETASDNRYVTVSGDDIIPDLMIGRLPVKSNAEATAMVNKIINYEQLPFYTGWNENILFVSDNPDQAGNFYVYSDKLVNTLLPNGYTPNKVYYGLTHTSVNDARLAILNGINSGSLMVNYIGHGSTTSWATENLFNKGSIASMTNTGKPAFFAALACLTGYFTIPSKSNQDNSSLSEALVKATDKAAIATFGSTGMGLAEGQDHLNRGLYKAIFYDGQTHLGEATLQAKVYLMSQATYFPDLLDTFMLFGDPAMKLKVLPSDLAVQLKASSNTNLLVGSPITYTLTYGNQGQAEASHIQIGQALPVLLNNLTIVRSDISDINLQPGNLSVELNKLNPGESGTIVVRGIVNSSRPTTISTAARIDSPIEDANPDNNVAGPVDTSVITESPTAVLFESSSAMPAPQMIRLVWSTADETQLISFDVYRSTNPALMGELINHNPIPAGNPSSMVGTEYEFHDDDVIIGETYFYTIVANKFEGVTSEGPLVATANAFAFLPLAAYQVGTK